MAKTGEMVGLSFYAFFANKNDTTAQSSVADIDPLARHL
ncbi:MULTISPECIES: DUF6500 family protein [Falsihalocynthiibacter]